MPRLCCSPNGDFETVFLEDWAEVSGDGSFLFIDESTGGNPDGYAIIDHDEQITGFGGGSEWAPDRSHHPGSGFLEIVVETSLGREGHIDHVSGFCDLGDREGSRRRGEKPNCRSMPSMLSSRASW